MYSTKNTSLNGYPLHFTLDRATHFLVCAANVVGTESVADPPFAWRSMMVPHILGLIGTVRVLHTFGWLIVRSEPAKGVEG